MQINRTLLLWSAVIIFIAIVGYFTFKDIPILTDSPRLSQSGEDYPEETAKTAPPGQNFLQKILSQISSKDDQPAKLKTYKNPEYEFEFTYPASFGEVAIKNEKCPRGFMTVGSFTNNPNIDFGFVSADYEKCNDDGFLLFETQTYDILDKKLKLYSSNPTSSVVEVAIEQTMSTLTPNINAYIIKNILEADGKGDAVAILRSPNPSIGTLTFRTHQLPYEDGVKLLEELIQN